MELQKNAANKALYVSLALGGFVTLATVIPALIASSAATQRAMNAVATATQQAEAHSIPVANLASLSVQGSPVRLAATTGVVADADHLMRVPLLGSRFASVTFQWDKDHLTHVDRFSFDSSDARRDDESIRTRLRDVLGRRWNKDAAFNWQGAYLSFDPKSGSLTASVSVPDTSDPHANWEKQVDALWDVARLAIGLPVRVDDSAVRDWLGRGYPLTQLATFDSQTDIDRSAAAMTRAFPGSTSSMSGGLDYRLALDHPWFGDAELRWPDAKAAHIERVFLNPPPEHSSKFSNQGDIDACMNRIYGKPAERPDPDHLTGDYSTEWHPTEGGRVRVFGHAISVWLSRDPWTKPMSDTGWKKLMNALDACGRRR
jgi:hypothetical protein